MQETDILRTMGRTPPEEEFNASATVYWSGVVFGAVCTVAAFGLGAALAALAGLWSF